MADNYPTVMVEPYIIEYVLKMTWQHHIERNDLAPAFQKITHALQKTQHPIRIVVDLSNDPQFPIADTLMEALRGPFRHPKLAEWLVFGTNRSARWIAELLSKSTQRSNIRWFDNEDEVVNYLNEHQ